MRVHLPAFVAILGCSSGPVASFDASTMLDRGVDTEVALDARVRDFLPSDSSERVDASSDVAASGDGAAQDAHTNDVSFSDTHQTTDAGTCWYPVVWRPESGRQANVRAALATSSPNATMTWNESLGTASWIQQLNLTFTCDDDQDYWEPLRALLLAHQAALQIEPSEWAHTAAPCRTFTSTARNLTFSRTTIGAQPIARDVVNLYFRRVSENVIAVASLVGTYIPHDTDIDAQLARCARIADFAVATSVRAHSYDYLIYRGSIACQPSRSGVYRPSASDTVAILPEGYASWFIRSDGVVFTRYFEAELRVGANNLTEDVRASNAYCPDGVGWVVRLDEVTGEVISVRAGIGCIVC